MKRAQQPDYGAGGRLGLATPQGNPTVEPEMRRLFPVDVEYYTMRLTSNSSDPRRRMLDYLEHLPEFVKRFANLSLDGLLFACTASSYLVPPDAQQVLRSRTEDQLDAPLFLAAESLRAWIEARGLHRIAMLSPYPDWLNELATDWWHSSGFDIVGSCRIDPGSADTYAIYEQQSVDARRHLATWSNMDADVWLITGTGMPTLSIVRELAESGRPVISSNLALAWSGLNSIDRLPVFDHA